MYSTELVANRLLEYAYARRNYGEISKFRLQKLMYLTAAEYGLETGKRLLAENFLAWKYGAVLCSIHYYYRGRAKFGRIVNDYFKDPQGRSFVVSNDSSLAFVVEKVMSATAHLSDQRLAQLTQVHSSAWSDSWQNRNDYLDWNKIIADKTLRNNLDSLSC